MLSWLPTWCPTSGSQLKDAEEKMLKRLLWCCCMVSEAGLPLGSNLDSLSSSGPVYCLDLLGFGRSSRPEFSSDPEGAEDQFLSALEEWREKVGLEEMVLLGHNLGGYLSAAYTLRYPNRSDAGPDDQWRETAFSNMTIPYGWAKRPMQERIGQIQADIPISFIYGSRSSIDSDSGYELKKTRPDVQITMIRGAGHYVFADQPDDFNQTVLQILATTERESKEEETKQR
ncbi:hypothetical protein KUCAC02_011670 [Chaenocephalus aceratus]|uniref:Uncharacterized protein n=1 Tax=Chaenocephalus aceratus TaxID=36190 RepID=A0ACB9WWH3_CHAAC|nr:hypothetical protein KUCAC02_011670 [Chaenocephalus aceratus]